MSLFDDEKVLLGYFEEKEGVLYYRYDAERLAIAPWGKNSLRITGTKLAEMPAENWALIEPQPSQVKISIDKYSAKIVNGKITAIINNIGKLEFYNHKGELLLEEYVRTRKDMYSSTCSSLEVEEENSNQLLEEIII